MPTDPKKDSKKTTNEKPLTLYPLTMDEALREVLQVKPPPKESERKPESAKKRK